MGLILWKEIMPYSFLYFMMIFSSFSGALSFGKENNSWWPEPARIHKTIKTIKNFVRNYSTLLLLRCCLLLNLNFLHRHVRVHSCGLLYGLCQGPVMINWVTVGLDGNLLFHSGFYDAISFSFILKPKYLFKSDHLWDIVFKRHLYLLTVIVSTVLVLELMVCELTISPVAL